MFRTSPLHPTVGGLTPTVRLDKTKALVPPLRRPQARRLPLALRSRGPRRRVALARKRLQPGVALPSPQEYRSTPCQRRLAPSLPATSCVIFHSLTATSWPWACWTLAFMTFLHGRS